MQAKVRATAIARRIVDSSVNDFIFLIACCTIVMDSTFENGGMANLSNDVDLVESSIERICACDIGSVDIKYIKHISPRIKTFAETKNFSIKSAGWAV